MPSFARIFQNEIVIKTLYCNKFAIHNTIDIVEVIGSSPTNPTKTKILETKAFQGFFFFRENALFAGFQPKVQSRCKEFQICIMPYA